MVGSGSVVFVSVTCAFAGSCGSSRGLCGILVDVEPPLAVVTLLRAVVDVEFRGKSIVVVREPHVIEDAVAGVSLGGPAGGCCRFELVFRVLSGA